MLLNFTWLIPGIPIMHVARKRYEVERLPDGMQLNHFKPYIPRPIHAIDIKCMTPAQAETAGDTVFHPHAGGTGIHIKRIQKHQNKE